MKFSSLAALAALTLATAPALAQGKPSPKWQCVYSEGKVFLNVAMVPDLQAEAVDLAMPDKSATLSGAMTFHLWITLNPDGSVRGQSTSLRLNNFRYQRKGQSMPDAKLSARMFDGDKDTSNDEFTFLDVARFSALERITPNGKILQGLTGPASGRITFTVAPIGTWFSQRYVMVPLAGLAEAKSGGITKAKVAKGTDPLPC
jgi:hypothetical protein